MMAKKLTPKSRRVPKDEEVDLIARNILLFAKELDKMYDALSSNDWNSEVDQAKRQILQDRQMNMLSQFAKLNNELMDQTGIMEMFLLNEAKSGNMRSGTFINGFWQYMNKRKIK